MNEFENFGSITSLTNDNQFTCDNDLMDPANGDDNGFVDEIFGTNVQSPKEVTGNKISLPKTSFFFS